MNTYFIRIRSQLNSGGLDGDLHVNSQPSSDLDSKIHDEKNSSTTGRNAYKKGIYKKSHLYIRMWDPRVHYNRLQIHTSVLQRLINVIKAKQEEDIRR